MVEQIRWRLDKPHTFFKNEDGIGLGREIREVKAIKNVSFSWLRRINLYDMTKSLEEIQKKLKSLGNKEKPKKTSKIF